MNVGVCRIQLRLPENDSLKGKRHTLRSITDRVKGRFNVAIAEVDDNDQWRFITLGVTCVTNDARHANEVLSHVVDYIDSVRGDAELLDYEVEVLTAF
ncbi:MAG: DUF503 domain-containing protein [Chloroflexi bacterium]|nr:DUF503 domain-containing protein [Chloroflexota bacterium]